MKLSKAVLVVILSFLFLPLTSYAQVLNGISNDGTTSLRFQIGDEGRGKLSVGISQDETPNRNFTLGDTLNAGSQSYVPGWAGTGWNIIYSDSDGYTLNIDNINVRNSFSAAEMIINQTRAHNGNLLISSSARVDSVSGNRVKWEDVTGHGLSVFIKNDIIMCQVINKAGATYNANGEVNYNQYLIKRLVLKVDSVTGLYTWLSYAPGAPSQRGSLKKGDTFTRISGSTIGLYADGPHTPYIMMTDSVTLYSQFITTPAKFYVGKLNGITDNMFGQLSGYGTYAENVYLKGKILINNPQDINASEINNDMGWQSGINITSGNTFPNYPALNDLHTTGDNPPQGFYKRTVYRFNGSTWEIVGLNGTLIDASGIYTGVVAASQVIAGTMTGFTIQTAASGKRVVISGSSNDISFNNSSGSLAGTITAGTNNLEVRAASILSLVGDARIELYSESGIFTANGNDIVTSANIYNYDLATQNWVSNNYAASDHTQAISTITGLQSALDSKASGSIGTSTDVHKSYGDVQNWYDEGLYLQKVPITINGTTIYVVTDIHSI